MTDDTRLAAGPLYGVGPLDARAVERAFALVRPVAPHVDLQRWRAFCARAEPAGRDLRLLAASDGAGTVRGLAGVRDIAHAARGPILDCPLFLIASALDPSGVADALLAALSRIARHRARTGLVVSTAVLDAALAARLAAAGAPHGRAAVFISVASSPRPC